MKLPRTKILAALLIISFSLPAKPLSDNQVGVIALTSGLATAAAIGIFSYNFPEKLPADAASIIVPVAGWTTGIVLALILGSYTPKSKFKQLSRTLNLLEIDHFLIKNFSTPEDFIQCINESFGGEWALIDGYNHLKDLLKQSITLEANLREIFIELNKSSSQYSSWDGKHHIEKISKIIDKIKLLISLLEKDNDFLRQKTLYIADVKQKAAIAATANIKNVAVKN
jgi:hypothetical protein